jgi:hypothetical protein
MHSETPDTAPTDTSAGSAFIVNAWVLPDGRQEEFMDAIVREGHPNLYTKLLNGDPFNVLSAIPWDELEAVSPAYRH